MLVLRR